MHVVCVRVYVCTCVRVRLDYVYRMFFIDKAGEQMTEQEQRRLDQRAQRFAPADGNRSFKKKLSVAELVQAAVSLP